MTNEGSINNVSPKIFVVTNSETKIQDPADFETAVKATGFGKYNLFLIAIAVPAAFSSMFETTTMSYVFPAAQCDLELSLNDKGLLNAITYLGTITSALIWGFLYDTLGRKKLLMIGFGLDAIFVLMSATSQSKISLMISKYLGGFIINGPFAAFTSYLSEFHAAEYRARMQLVLGTLYGFGGVVMPLLALWIIPQDIYFSLFNKTLEFHSWNVYLLICGLPSAISAIAFFFLPESPKFLMTTGRNDKALTIFRKVYSSNASKSKDSYPITELVDEIKMKNEKSQKHGGVVTANRSKVQALREGWQQIKPMFFKPHLKNVVLVCVLQTLFTMSLNTLRLWIPQIFQAIADYEFYHNGSTANLCTMLEMIQPNDISDEECVVNFNNSSVYTNSIIISIVQMCSYFFAGYLINKLGKKKLIGILAVIGGSCCCGMYYSTNMVTILTLASLFQSSGSISTNVVLTVIIDLFPTTLRTMTVAVAMMLGRAGAMIGNALFPFLLEAGCAPPFFTIGTTMFVCVFVTIFLPNTDLKALE